MTKVCKAEDCECYPYYGMAPHKHIFREIGTATVLDHIPDKQEDWPSNFTPIAEENNMTGIWYCPECLSGQEEEREKLTKKENK